MANTNTREAAQRARAKLAERRAREDELIDTVTGALVAREEATKALGDAEAAITDAVAGLAELGIGRDELAAILEVPAEQLGGRTRARARKAVADTAASMPPADAPATPAAPAEKPARARKARAASRRDADGS